MIIEEMTMPEFEAGLKRCRTVYLPFGSCEEHGSHLPLSTDTIEAYEVGKRAAERIPLFVAPPIHYGSCRSTSCHPGTVSISTGTLKAILKDLVRSFRAQGMKNFVVLTGHAGGSHKMALQDAGEEMIVEFDDINVAVVTEFDLAKEAGAPLIETRGDAHAGEIETSRILHSHPQLVKGTAPEEYPSFPNGILVRDKRSFWPGGVWGNPAKATAEKGRKLETIVADRVVELVKTLESRAW
ncbi:creatininase family protein [Geomesophilobacter sediminis]|uniref:Creatininase family protein n=1 Tax=Geomesophilobacter sediminis TaxID=2798584 RepID=A0A8J7JBF9_9BACT|nr:creatininase family protein [Geomesophilobacter sediminis]MBJ6723908.1 creatininase family protein [Geomesophilobacter sediminis]